ncbi:CD320 antigen-like [Stylophora pistillata]|uniref:CD320 antigen-like n=1 Tax=Stylophora pistillata TaxID=50429 RepID=UPI000C043642|nr:CD320 antigen-like [Stylophora pistillata]
MDLPAVLLLILVAVPCTSARKCENYQFTCANGICLSKWYRCRYGDDCGDTSDEQQCHPECWSCRGLNPPPPAQQSGAVPIELTRRRFLT